MESSTFSIVGSNFTNNTANFNGGAIENSRSRVDESRIIDDCIFINNIGSDGGAIYIYGVNVTINSCSFEFNAVNGSGYAGAVYNYDLWNDTILNIINSRFVNNTSENIAGALFNENGLVDIIGSIFINNTAKYAGAIYNANVYHVAEMNISSSTFINNSALNTGGAIYNGGNALMLLFNNTMNGNLANVGNVIFNNGQMGVLNLTFMNNSTVYPKNNTAVVYATLTDDMGNPVTWKNVTFTIDGVVFTNMSVEEGLVSFTHDFIPEGNYTISGNYNGNGIYNINIFDGIIAFKSDIISDLSLDKNKSEVNEIVTGKVTVINNGNAKESNINVVVYLTDNFVLDFVPSGAVHDSGLNTLTWVIDSIDPDNSLVFEFLGYFTVSGNYTFISDVYNNNFSSNDSEDIEVVKTDNITSEPKYTPIPTPNPSPNPSPIYNPTLNETKDTNNTNTGTDKIIANAAVMKETGMPLITLLLVLLSSLGLVIRKK